MFEQIGEFYGEFWMPIGWRVMLLYSLGKKFPFFRVLMKTRNWLRILKLTRLYVRNRVSIMSHCMKVNRLPLPFLRYVYVWDGWSLCVRLNECSNYSLLPPFIPLSWRPCGQFISLHLNFVPGNETRFGQWHVGRSGNVPVLASVLRKLMAVLLASFTSVGVMTRTHTR